MVDCHATSWWQCLSCCQNAMLCPPIGRWINRFTLSGVEGLKLLPAGCGKHRPFGHICSMLRKPVTHSPVENMGRLKCSGIRISYLVMSYRVYYSRVVSWYPLRRIIIPCFVHHNPVLLNNINKWYWYYTRRPYNFIVQCFRFLSARKIFIDDRWIKFMRSLADILWICYYVNIYIKEF